MYKLGLTGGIATGKSTVSTYLHNQGLPVIDADKVAHDILSDAVVLAELKETFGETIFADGVLSRPALGQIVFGDSEALAKLNNLTHPRIYQRIDELGQRYEDEGEQLVVYDIPLLLETPNKMTFDGIMVVVTDPEQQLQRLMARNNLSQVDAQKRIASQMPIVQKAKWADFVINNNNSTEETFKQVAEVLQTIND